MSGQYVSGGTDFSGLLGCHRRWGHIVVRVVFRSDHPRLQPLGLDLVGGCSRGYATGSGYGYVHVAALSKD